MAEDSGSRDEIAKREVDEFSRKLGEISASHGQEARTSPLERARKIVLESVQFLEGSLEGFRVRAGEPGIYRTGGFNAYGVKPSDEVLFVHLPKSLPDDGSHVVTEFRSADTAEEARRRGNVMPVFPPPAKVEQPKPSGGLLRWWRRGRDSKEARNPPLAKTDDFSKLSQFKLYSITVAVIPRKNVNSALLQNRMTDWVTGLLKEHKSDYRLMLEIELDRESKGATSPLELRVYSQKTNARETLFPKIASATGRQKRGFDSTEQDFSISLTTGQAQKKERGFEPDRIYQSNYGLDSERLVYPRQLTSRGIHYVELVSTIIEQMDKALLAAGL